jgi:hypothetical protein
MINRYQYIKIYFHCFPQGKPEKTAYQHGMVCLAEGFELLGVKFYSDRNYWKKSLQKNDYLFKHNPDVKPDDCDIVITGHDWIAYGRKLPEGLLRRNRKYRAVYMDESDGQPTFSWYKEARKFDVILRSHYNLKLNNPSNMKPWAFGLSDRIIRYTENSLERIERKKTVLINFRSDHSLRRLIKKEVFDRLIDVLPQDTTIESFNPDNLEPIDRIFWEQTGRRHYPDYYQRLKSILGCVCVGGFNIPPVFTNNLLAQNIWRKLTRPVYFNSGIIAQFDSWRFWEALAAGCASFHLDLEKYGLALPVMPENWKHYIGLNLDNRKDSVLKIRKNLEQLPEIALAGKEWAIKHYSPEPTARRFLDTVLGCNS